MLVMVGNTKILIPDEVIDQHAASFEPLRKWDNRGSLMRLREDIYDIMFCLMDDPTLIHEPDFVDDLANAFAMRQGLEKIKLLHDA